MRLGELELSSKFRHAAYRNLSSAICWPGSSYCVGWIRQAGVISLLPMIRLSSRPLRHTQSSSTGQGWAVGTRRHPSVPRRPSSGRS